MGRCIVKVARGRADLTRMNEACRTMGEGKERNGEVLQAGEGSLQTAPSVDSVTTLLDRWHACQIQSRKGRGKIFTGSAFITC
jgi:hypothetical protein